MLCQSFGHFELKTFLPSWPVLPLVLCCVVLCVPRTPPTLPPIMRAAVLLCLLAVALCAVPVPALAQTTDGEKGQSERTHPLTHAAQSSMWVKRTDLLTCLSIGFNWTMPFIFVFV